jgi:predicted small secreted protein
MRKTRMKQTWLTIVVILVACALIAAWMRVAF